MEVRALPQILNRSAGEIDARSAEVNQDDVPISSALLNEALQAVGERRRASPCGVSRPVQAPCSTASVSEPSLERIPFSSGLDYAITKVLCFLFKVVLL
jgi:hypothetical protein